jgi:pyruvate/2-oxoacid:ferredoxin oxidoreductase beta subunit
MKVLDEDIILFGAPGCGTMLVGQCQVSTHVCLMTNVAATMTGVRRYYRSKGREVRLVAYIGDGATADIGFQSLSGAAERGENLIYICYDNEAYMNTGVQRSSTTPYGAWTFTSPVGPLRHGKEQPGKYLPLLMAFHGVPYVATASISHLEDYARKLTRAMEVREGMAYIHLFCPCPIGWRAPVDSTIEVSNLAVETNYFPLWEAVGGRFTLNYQPPRPRPVGDFTQLMGRFAHLTPQELARLQQAVDERLTLIRILTNRGGQEEEKPC